MIGGELHTQGLQDLNKSIREYLQVTSKTSAHALEFQADKFRWAVYRGFRNQRVERGTIRQAARARGWKTEVRPSIRRKVDEEFGGMRLSGLEKTKKVTVAGRRVRLNKQALAVHRELSLRERGRGYLGVSWLFRGWTSSKPGQTPRSRRFHAKGRAGRQLAKVDIRMDRNDQSIRIKNWTPGVEEVDERIGIIDRAAAAVHEDIQRYLIDRQLRALDRAMRGGRAR